MPSPLLRRSALAAGIGLAVPMALALPASAETEVDRPDSFTSAFTVNATGDNIINGDGESVPGSDGTGTFTYMINSDEEIICYDLTTTDVEPPYESPAKTATHIHEAVAGQSGPPRLAFPNPEGDGPTRTSSGCLQGPFTTGVEDDEGNDTGDGFTLSMIETNPANFFGDTHTAEFVPGAVRGQLTPMPVGGVETGQGGLAGESGSAAAAGAAAAVVAATALGGIAVRRRVRG